MLSRPAAGNCSSAWTSRSTGGDGQHLQIVALGPGSRFSGSHPATALHQHQQTPGQDPKICITDIGTLCYPGGLPIRAMPAGGGFARCSDERPACAQVLRNRQCAPLARQSRSCPTDAGDTFRGCVEPRDWHRLAARLEFGWRNGGRGTDHALGLFLLTPILTLPRSRRVFMRMTLWL